MKRFFVNLSSLAFVLMACLFTLNVNAQEVKEKKQIYTYVENPPSFPGGEKALSKYFVENIIYPNDAKEKGIEGKVYLQFVINSEGSVTDIKVIRGAGNTSLDEEAIRVVKTMPKWIPGKQNGKIVDVQFTLPIVFKLDGDKKK
jgi:protein TonB